MTSSIELVFSSTHPMVIASWHEMQEGWSAYLEATRDMRPVQNEGCNAVVRVGFSHDRHVIGYTNPDNEDPPHGWRVQAKDGLLVPNKRLKLGKELHKSLPSFAGPRLPGMPRQGMHDLRWFVPAVNLWDGVLWVHWNGPIEDVDPTYWRDRKLSEYHAAKEANHHESVS